MKKNIALAALLVMLGAGGAYLYITFTRTAPKGGKVLTLAICKKHQMPESECPFCDKSLIEKMGQCAEHGVPEALCHKCNPALVPAFKAAGDWCAGHNVPESQCDLCQAGQFPPGEKI